MSRNSGTRSGDSSGKNKKFGIALVTLVVLLALGGVGWFFPTASNQGYAPAQPIPFSHKIHAGVNKIDCKYCHSAVEKSRHSTVPALSVCMNCHTVVRPDSPYIQQVQKAWKEGKPIEWVRVHELPDYVYFSHKRHVTKGLACETCHGDVKNMDRIYQFSPLTMGWCMECHRGQTTPKHILAKVYPNVKDPQGPVAPVNCTTCHN